MTFAAPLDRTVGPTCRPVRAAKRGFEFVRNLVEPAAFDGCLGCLAVINEVFDSSGQIALCRHYVELCQPTMPDGIRGFGELLGPRDRFKLLDPHANECRAAGDGGGRV
jgi:hypothetical protein